MKLTEKDINSICEAHEFTSFWELFDYLVLAAYSEPEALLIASEKFNGDIWGNVINVAKCNPTYGADDLNFTFGSGYTYSVPVEVVSSGTSLQYAIMGTDVARDTDDLIVEMFLMTNNGNPKHKAIYKAYVETRKYEPLAELEGHIKTLKVMLKTELAIKLFNEGFSKF